MMTKNLCLIAALASAGALNAANDAAKRLDEAATALSEIMSAPDKGIPQDLLNRATCIVIVPGLKKGAFVIGIKYGRGFVNCRKESGQGWSAPAGVRVEGGSFGFQAGGSETDVVLLVMNHTGMKKLLSSKFTLGADASAAAGPVGRTSSAQTDAQLRAEILTWSRSRGLFVGVSLEGATLRPDGDANEEMYHTKTTNKGIVMGNTQPPADAARLEAELNRYSGRK